MVRGHPASAAAVHPMKRKCPSGAGSTCIGAKPGPGSAVSQNLAAFDPGSCPPTYYWITSAAGPLTSLPRISDYTLTRPRVLDPSCPLLALCWRDGHHGPRCFTPVASRWMASTACMVCNPGSDRAWRWNWLLPPNTSIFADREPGRQLRACREMDRIQTWNGLHEERA